jgi:hypothetical protein
VKIDLFKNMDNVNQKIITMMHEQLNGHSITNYKTIQVLVSKPTTFFQPTTFFKNTAKVIEDENLKILKFMSPIMSSSYPYTKNRMVLWAFLTMYMSLTYLVNIKTGVKLAGILYNDSIYSDKRLPEKVNKIIKYIISNKYTIKIKTPSGGISGRIKDILSNTANINTALIDLNMGLEEEAPTVFTVMDRYIDYLKSIIANQQEEIDIKRAKKIKYIEQQARQMEIDRDR